MGAPLLTPDDVTEAFESSIEALAARIENSKDDSKLFTGYLAEKISLSEKDARILLTSLTVAAQAMSEDQHITVAGCLMLGFDLGVRAVSKFNGEEAPNE